MGLTGTRRMRQIACLGFNPIMVKSYAALFSCTAVAQASDSIMASNPLHCFIIVFS